MKARRDGSNQLKQSFEKLYCRIWNGMDVYTLFFVVLELVMFGVQLGYYLNQPENKSRFWYLILLFLLLIYNITGGFSPVPQIKSISVYTQIIIAYGSGLLMAAYLPFYFYKAFELKLLRFHAIYGVPLFLLLPYLIFFVITFSFYNNLDFTIKHGVIVPFFYSFFVLRAILIAIRKHYKENQNHHYYMEEIAVYCAIVPWAAMIPIAYFNFSQLVEVFFTNLGFTVITIMFIYKSVQRARKENILLAELDLKVTDPVTINKNCKRFGLTCRETEVVILVCQRFKSKEIGEKLFISERTVNKHVENIYSKVLVTTRMELIQKIAA